MKTAVKRYLFLGLTLSIMALTGIRNKLEEVSAESDLDSLRPPQKPGATNPNLLADKAPDVVSKLEAAAMSAPKVMSATTVTFSGTVERNGSRFVLRETGGTLY